MAYRRSLMTNARLISRERLAPSFSCTHHEDDRKNSNSNERVKSFLQSRSYGCNYSTNTWPAFGGMSFRSQYLRVPMTTSGLLLARNMSTTNGDGEDKIKCMADKTMEVVSSTSEVVAAAADLPVAALQHAINGIHLYTGLDWWASIVITTLVIRTLSIPLMINQIKVTSKLNSLQPELELIKQEMQNSGLNADEGRKRMKRLYKEHGVTHYSPLKTVIIKGAVYGSIFLAIQNMVEKVPSLQTGGISWFTDLTTPDSFYILPLLGAFSFWAATEANMQKDAALKMKYYLRGFSALTFPIAAILLPSIKTNKSNILLSQALLCSWIAFNSFSLVFGLIIKRASVKKLLNITIIDLPEVHRTKEAKASLDASLKALNDAAAESMRQGFKHAQSIASSSLLTHKKE